MSIFSDIRVLSFKNTSIGADGVRSISPYLSKSKVRVLTFEKCDLTDNSMVYISSIVKAQEAVMDTVYWNSTLREDSPLGDLDILIQAHTCGLQALNISGNSITSNGLLLLAKALRRNQWLVGKNFL